MSSQSSSELAHYGIRGMRWGVRRNSDGTIEDTGKLKRGERSQDSAEVKELRRHHVSTLSNAEIRKINERMQLEQSYRNLERSSSVIGQGRREVSSILSDVGNLERALRITDGRAWELGSAAVTGVANSRAQRRNAGLGQLMP